MESQEIPIIKQDDWIFYKTLDHIGDDIGFVGRKTINELKEITNRENGVAFNTLGYIKCKVNEYNLCKSKYFCPSDGIYIKRKHNLLLLTPITINDIFILYPMVQYYSKIYTDIYIFTTYKNHFMMNQIYEYHNNIHIIKINDPSYYGPISKTIFNEYTKQLDLNNFNVIKTGHTSELWDVEYNEHLYSLIGLDPNIINDKQYLRINRNEQREDELYDKVISIYGDKYIFAYNDNHKNINNDNDNDLPILYPKYNYYNDNHKYYKYWDETLNVTNILDYCKIIENAEEIHISDHAIGHLIPYLDLTKVINKCIY